MVEDRKSKIKVTKNTNKLNALSFFSGAMGLDLGLHKVGIRTLLACEPDNSCRKTITANNNKIGLIGDIRNYSIPEILEHAGVNSSDDVDLIVGGPPCQAFSSAGKRLGFGDEKGNVFLSFLDVIQTIKPKYVVIENVRGILSSVLNIELPVNEYKIEFNKGLGEKGSVMHYIFGRLKKIGYNVSFNLYNTANYGTPQTRERVIIICTLDKRKVPYLKPTHSNISDFKLPIWRTLKDALKDLPSKPNDYIKFPDKRLKYLKLLKPGQNWKNLKPELQEEALGKAYHLTGGKTGFYRRLGWNKPSPTLVTNPTMPATSLCHPTKNRPLSVQEYKRIQEFPDSWEICGSILNQYKQIGNAVPVSLGIAIGKTILNHHKKKRTTEVLGFKYSRYLNTSDISFFE